MFEELANFGGAVGGRLRGGEPALDFRDDVVVSRDGVGLQARVTKKLQQFAERNRADVRRVA